MSDTRRKNAVWNLPTEKGAFLWEHAQIAVMMDIRDELQKLNGLLHCQNFLSIPRVLAEIRRNTTKPRKRKAAAKRSGK